MIGRKLNPEDLEVQACVYKLFCGDRYLIAKGKTLAGSIYLIEKGYASYIAGGGGTGNNAGGQGQGEADRFNNNTFYRKFYKYVRENPMLPIRHEVMIESENVYLLLKTEQLCLDEAFSDKKCLNNNITSYIPIWRKKYMSYGWMNRGSVLAFRKFLKNKPIKPRRNGVME